MEKLEEKIITLLKKDSSKKYDLEKLKKIVDVNSENEQIEEILKECLLNLEIKEKIYCNDGKYIIFPKEFSKRVGNVLEDDKGEYYCYIDNKKVYLVNYENLGVIKKDVVMISNITNYKNKTYGTVDRILKRENNTLVADCIINNGKLVLSPKNQNFKYKINPTFKNRTLVDGDRILVLLDKFNDSSYNASYLSMIGHKDDPILKIKTLAAEDGIYLDFSEQSLEELKHIDTYVESCDIKDRVDLRNEVIFTIDSSRTKDMDDAISLKINDKGNYVLGVHISDVPHYIKFGSSLQQDASIKGNSTYPANYCFPMLPHQISNGICSLNPNVDRLTISTDIEIDKKGEIIDYNVYLAVINSSKKMTYEAVNKILDEKCDLTAYTPYIKTLEIMRELHQILDERKRKRGYLDFGDNDLIVNYDEEGNVSSVIKEIRGTGEKLIEDFMLITNEVLTDHLYWQNLNLIYRNHDKPNKDKMIEILEEIKSLGLKIKIPQNFNNSLTMQGIMNSIKNTPVFPLLSNKILRGMKIADYDNKTIGHYGLALPRYATFTSPIRRYADYMNMIAIKESLGIDNIIPYSFDKKEKLYKESSLNCSKTQFTSDRFEQKINRISAIDYIKNHNEEIFPSIICSLGKKYISVMLENGIIGKINIEDLGKNYELNNSTLTLSNGIEEFKIGDEIDVKFKKVIDDNIYFKSNKAISRVRI